MSAAKTIRVAIIGVGQMGQNHLRVYDRLKGVEIAGIFDTDKARAQELANRYGCAVFSSLDQIAGAADAASVCVSSAFHCEVGLALLNRGIPCLIEKPLATTEAEALQLLAAAQRSGAPLMVGHIERFNPAVQELAKLLDGRIHLHAIGARRLSGASARITDVDVVLDLMVHDLDIVLWLVGKPVVSVAASGVSATESRGQDYVTALLNFQGGVSSHLTASRITQTKVRELHLTTDMGFITVNYLAQELLVFRQGGTDRAPYHWSNDRTAVLDSVMERVLVRNAEPLVLELEHFVQCVRTGSMPLVTGQHALETLQTVWRIQAETARVAGRG